jgi:hypothetical protein
VDQETLVVEMQNVKQWVIAKFVNVLLDGLEILKLSVSNVGFFLFLLEILNIPKGKSCKIYNISFHR